MTGGKRALFATAALLVMTAVLAAVGCGGNGEIPEGKTPELSGTLNLSGSTTLLPIAQEAAEMFMEENPGVTVNVQGGGSSVGISNVSEGVVDIGNSSRDLKEEEKNLGLVDHKIALDVLAIIVHKDVPVDNLTGDQVFDIFTGRITNWKEVGGPDRGIVVVVRDEASGTREMFDEKALKNGKPVKGAIECNSNGIVRQTVSSTPYSIGYVSLGYLDGSVKAVKYDGVTADVENAVNKIYPLTRYLHMFTRGEPTGLAKAFIDFVLSDRFQNQVVAREYIPVSRI